MTKARAGVKRVRVETSQGGVEPPVEGGHQNMKFSLDAELSRIPAPHLLKQEQLQLAGASFRDHR